MERESEKKDDYDDESESEKMGLGLRSFIAETEIYIYEQSRR